MNIGRLWQTIGVKYIVRGNVSAQEHEHFALNTSFFEVV